MMVSWITRCLKNHLQDLEVEMEKNGEIKVGVTPPELDLTKDAKDCSDKCGCQPVEASELAEHLTKRVADKAAECQSDN